MKYLTVLLFVCLTAQSVYASDLGDQLGSALIKRYQPTINAFSQHGWDHSNSIILHGMEKLYLKNKNPKYFLYIKTFVDEYVDTDGGITGLLTTLDGIHPGVLCLFMYQQTQDDKYLKAAMTMRKHLMGTKAQASKFQKTPDGSYWHKNNKNTRTFLR